MKADALYREISCFKAYDLRGRVPEQLDEDIAARVGRGIAQWLNARRVVIGRDIRLSSEALANALTDGLTSCGADVFDLGLCGTEEIYFATAHENMDAGVMITASHNPPDCNGMKIVREGSRPVSADSGLIDIRRIAEAGTPGTAKPGARHGLDTRDAYLAALLGSLGDTELAPLTLVMNPGNGCAAPVLERLEPHLPCKFLRLQWEPDGRFPNGVPNPLLPEHRSVTAEAVRKHGADMGIAWDGDFDRCFLFDETGAFVEGYYIVGLLAQAFLEGEPGGRIVHDPRLVWNTQDLVSASGGVAVQSKAGHAFIKEKMREVDAVYGGEMSAHHYFRDFAYCDSGMLSWLAVAKLISASGETLSQLLGERQNLFPASGEINRAVRDVRSTLARVEAQYAPRASAIDRTDGISFDYGDWRFNLRASNTEPLIRLNVESRGDRAAMESATAELLAFIERDVVPR